MVVPNGYIQEHISLVHLGSNKFTRKRTDVAKSNLDLCHSVLNMFNFRISSLTSVSSPSLTDSVPISDLRLSQSSHADEEPDPFFFLRTAVASVLTQQSFQMCTAGCTGVRILGPPNVMPAAVGSPES